MTAVPGSPLYSPNYSPADSECRSVGSFDVWAAFSKQPPKPDFIWPGFLSGTVGALISPGGAGKSFFALQAAMAVACRTSGGDILGLGPNKCGRVFYFAAEDPASAVAQRVYAMGRHLPQHAKKSISENLTIELALGRRLDLTKESQLGNLISQCLAARLVIFDTLSRIHSKDENNNGDMARVVGSLELVAAKTGAAVLYLHHVSKGSVQEGWSSSQQAARGASALIDNARWCGYIARMSEEESKRLSKKSCRLEKIGFEGRAAFLKFGVNKQNHDTKCTDRWFERIDDGVLVPAELVEATNGRKGVWREQA